MYQSIPSLTIPPGQNPQAIFLMGEFPTPQGKKSLKPPPPGPIKWAKTPPPEAFSSITHYKNMKKMRQVIYNCKILSSLDN